MDTYYELKHLYCSLAAGQRHLRKWEVKLRDKAARFTGANHLNEQREGIYKERMSIRGELRTLNLVRGFLSGREYTEIEASHREGNAPDLAHVFGIIRDLRLGYAYEEIEEWYNGNS